MLKKDACTLLSAVLAFSGMSYDLRAYYVIRYRSQPENNGSA
jgi:hypothetical protein